MSSATATRREYPHSLDAERSLLGQCLTDDALILEAGRIVTPEEFYRADHGRLFGKLLEMAADGPVDQILVIEAMHDDAERYGGIGYVLDLFGVAVSTANWRHYAAIIRQHAQRRDALAAIEQAHEGAQDRTADVSEIVDQALARLSSVGDAYGRDDEGWIGETINEIDEASATATTEGHQGLPIPLDALAEIIDVEPGKMIVIMAHTGHGKTSMALSWLSHFALEGVPAGYFSLEMHRNELLRRQLAAASGIPEFKHRKGYLQPAEWQQWHAAAEPFKTAPIRYIDRSGLTINDVRARAFRLDRQLKRLGFDGLRCLFIDYLQRLRPTDPRAPRSQAVAEMSNGCKDIAQELQIPVVVLAQPNRMALGEVDKRPKLHHLKDSGTIEQDADIVIGLYYHARTLPDVEARTGHWPNYYEAEVLKNRGGGLGRAVVHFTPHLTRFRDCTTDEYRSWLGPEQAARQERENKPKRGGDA